MKKLLWFILLIPSLALGQALDRTHVNYRNPLSHGTNCTDTTLNSTTAAVSAGSDHETVILTRTDRAKVPCIWTFANNVTIPAKVTLYVPSGVQIDADGHTLTFAAGSRFIADGYVFTTNDPVSFAGSSVDFIDPRWWGDDYSLAQVNRMLTATSSNSIMLKMTPGTWNVTDNLTISYPIDFFKGAVFLVSPAKTLTIDCSYISDYIAQIKSGSGSFLCSKAGAVSPNWSGAKAVDATDDTAAIKEAILSARNGHGYVYPAETGKYVVSDTLVFSGFGVEPVNLIGNVTDQDHECGTSGAWFYSNMNKPLIEVSGNNISDISLGPIIKDICLENESTNSSNWVIHAQHITFLRTDNVIVRTGANGIGNTGYNIIISSSFKDTIIAGEAITQTGVAYGGSWFNVNVKDGRVFGIGWGFDLTGTTANVDGTDIEAVIVGVRTNQIQSFVCKGCHLEIQGVVYTNADTVPLEDLGTPWVDGGGPGQFVNNINFDDCYFAGNNSDTNEIVLKAPASGLVFFSITNGSWSGTTLKISSSFTQDTEAVLPSGTILSLEGQPATAFSYAAIPNDAFSNKRTWDGTSYYIARADIPAMAHFTRFGEGIYVGTDTNFSVTRTGEAVTLEQNQATGSINIKASTVALINTSAIVAQSKDNGAVNFTPLDDPPVNPALGDFYVDSSGAACLWTGASWTNLGVAGTCS